MKISRLLSPPPSLSLSLFLPLSPSLPFSQGGGAIEMELSKYLRDYSRTVAGKEQLIIATVAKALEVIPRTLCDNAGFDSTNILNRLRERHSKGREEKWSLCIIIMKHVTL